MPLHTGAQAAYGTPLGQTYQQAVQIKQGLGQIQQQRAQMEEAQQRQGAEQQFAQIAGQFKGNPRGALNALLQGGHINPQQFTAQMQAISNREEEQRRYQTGVDAKAQAALSAQAQDIQGRGALAAVAQERGATGPELIATGTGALGEEFVEGLAPESGKPFTLGKTRFGPTGDIIASVDGADGADALNIGAVPYQYKAAEIDEGGGRQENVYRLTQSGVAKAQAGEAVSQRDYELVASGSPASSDVPGGIENPQVAAMAEAIYKDRVPADWSTKRASFRGFVLSRLARDHPDFNISEKMAKFKFRQDAPTNRSIAVMRSLIEPGGGAESIIDEYESAYKDLELSEYPLWNTAKMTYLEQTGDPRVTRAANLRTSMAMEVGQALSAAALTDKRLEIELTENLRKAASPAQVRAAVKVIKEVVSARMREQEAEQARPPRSRGAAQPGEPKFKILSVQ